MRGCGAVAAAALLACTPADTVPDVYVGHSGNVVLHVPSRVAASILYDGESDWAARHTPLARRTARDVITTIEFFVDLDHPDTVQFANDASARQATWSGSLHLPAVFGHVISATVNLAPGRGGDLAEFQRNVVDSAPGAPLLRPDGDRYGLHHRGLNADAMNAVQRSHLHDLFTTAEDYMSVDHQTYISCNDAHMSVSPFSPMPTCSVHVSDPLMHATILTSVDRGDLPGWRSLRQALIGTLRSFRTTPDPHSSVRASSTSITGTPSRIG